MLKWLRKKTYPLLSQHLEHKGALVGFLIGCLMIPFNIIRVSFMFLITGTLAHLFFKVKIEHDFFNSIKRHQFKDVRQFLEKNPDLIYSTDAQGFYPLHQAIKSYDSANLESKNVFLYLYCLSLTIDEEEWPDSHAFKNVASQNQLFIQDSQLNNKYKFLN